MTPPRQTMVQTFAQKVVVNGGLEKAPKKRREQKVKNSMIGLVIMAGGLATLGFTGYLAMHKADLWVLAGGVGTGGILLAFGGLAADRETFGPVLKTLFSFWRQAEKVRRR